MKRLLLAALAALMLHGLLFAFVPGLPEGRSMEKPRHLTVALCTRPVETPEMTAPAPLSNPDITQPNVSPSPVVGDPQPPREEPPRLPEERPPRPTTRPKALAKVRAEAKHPRRVTTSPFETATPQKEEEIAPPLPDPPPRSDADSSVGPATDPADISRQSPLSEEAGRKGERSGMTVDVRRPMQGAAPAGEGESQAGQAVKDVVMARPAYRDNPRPDYPKVARRLGYEGTVVLEVLVSSSGKPEELRVAKSSGYDVLDRSAITSVKNWLFEPGRIGGRKVDMWVRVPVRFELRANGG